MIITFTSEHPSGGLAFDVAARLGRWGYKTLYIDWSLYSEPSVERGLADLIVDRIDPLELVNRTVLSGRGLLDVIPPGTIGRLPRDQAWWAREYSGGLADFLEECAEQWRTTYEVVVICGGPPGDPSRGIPVVHMSDAVVVECSGGEAAALKIASVGRDQLPYGRAELLVLPLNGAAEEFEPWMLSWVHATIRPESVAKSAARDRNVLAALLANGFAGTEHLAADADKYVFAAQHRDAIVEGARIVRSRMPQMGLDGIAPDRVLRDLLCMRPLPTSRLLNALVVDDDTELWTFQLATDPLLRPPEAQPALGVGSQPVRYACPVDGNFVCYRHNPDALPSCPDHEVVLEAAQLSRRGDPVSLFQSIVERVGQWTSLGETGVRRPEELEHEALALLAWTRASGDVDDVLLVVAMSELQRASLISGDPATDARDRALALLALRADTDDLPAPLLSLIERADWSTPYRAAGTLWRSARSRHAPDLVDWAELLVSGPWLDAESILSRVDELLDLEASAGVLSNVDEAIFLSRTALSALPRDSGTAHTELAMTTASMLVEAHASTADILLLDEAVELLRPLVSERYSWTQASVGLMYTLLLRYTATGSDADLDEMITLGEHARHTEDERALSYVSMLMASAFAVRSVQSRSKVDANRAARLLGLIDSGRSAQGDDQFLAHFVSSLRAAERSLSTAWADDWMHADHALSLYRAAVPQITPSPEKQIQLAVRWAHAAEAQGDRSGALQAWAAAVNAVLLLATIEVDAATRGHVLTEWANVPREAAARAIAMGEPATALEFLENGRSVLLSETIDLRSEFSRLDAEHPALARHLEALTRKWSRQKSDFPAAAIAQEWAAVMREARREPGFEGFFRTATADELIAALGDRTVVVLNAATTRCDALVVSGAGIRVIPLGVALDDVAAMAADLHASTRRALSGVVERLWHTVVLPVLEAISLPSGSRLWWCPTGPFTTLPVHAAGTADDGVFHRVVSSYTTTIIALVRAGRPGVDGPAVFVGVGHVPGSALPTLPAVLQEASNFRAAVHVDPRLLLDEQATRAQVRSAASDAAVLHLSCHAMPSSDHPSNAGLALWDGPLTVREFAEARTTPPQLVFLAACHSAAVGSQRVTDEPIPIVAAFHEAGSQSVVGTLWEADDRYSEEVTSGFYQALQDSAEPASALHVAVRTLRERDPADVSAWAPFVHVGS